MEIRIIHEGTLSSTNDAARKLALAGEAEGCIVTCEEQTAGRGRLGRSWKYAEGSLAMSMLLRPCIPADRISMITIIAAMAVRNALEKCCMLSTGIKWPNDIKCGGRKLCGILTEGVFAGNRSFAVLGIGINLLDGPFDDEIKDIAGSVEGCGGKNCEKDRLILSIASEFDRYYRRLQEDGDLSGFLEEYTGRCQTIGKYVTVSGRTALAQGIDTMGRLIVSYPDGSSEAVVSGEVNLR